ncbi:penicillin-binding protein 2 [candidate division WS6 bacterium RIFOXYC1_FULL_33_10]|uniref:Penicillin-binding protein 2 n=1 Tax=candidate division WS6 bacterium RIFOXYC1_FULL_33_10 TaxID=1802606 RepID=A0A1F4UIH6_9BACT|nr:MAG: penicillin-binding protein 2 [candidate division WS6 bacterium RIFOXYC1_FULL_33_10]
MASRILFDKKLDKKKLHKPLLNWKVISPSNVRKRVIAKVVKNGNSDIKISGWNFIYAFLMFGLVFSSLVFSIARLQIVEGEQMLERSEQNKVRKTSVKAFRGVIFDSKGEKLVENVPSMNVYISLEPFLQKDGSLDNGKVEKELDTLGGILGESWESKEKDGTQYSNLSERFFTIYDGSPYINKILLASDIDNELAIKIKAKGDDLEGISIDNDSKRRYIYSDMFTHILGYTGEASEKDLEKYQSLSSGDSVGKSGVERYYEEKLQGTNGVLVEEIDVFGRSVTKEPYLLTEAVSGQNLYLSIDKDVQKKLYDLLKSAVKKYSAAGGAGVIQDVNTGEILAIVSYPSYDNNLFVGGISQSKYNALLKDKGNPLLDRALSAQIPPGSTFKTVVAAGGLDSGAITSTTRYISKSGYTFSNGAPFQEFRNGSYGSLNVVQALTVSSNIFFCEMIRDWRMSELVPYLQAFGIGEYTGIDIPGEAPGRLPSPENKIKLAQTTSPWLEPVWYPEGDSCNSVIGQGITLVTPIQMSNWMATIANGGKVLVPHVAKKFVDEDGFEYPVEYSVVRENIISKSALDLVKKGMWETVNGSRGIVHALSNTGTSVAAKTGTAEFGKVNEKGIYEDTHAWVGGFFPYENPKYSFSLLLEDGGMSSNSTAVMREMITWLVQKGYVK